MNDDALPITAYAVCNCLGRTNREFVEALAGSRSGLASPPLELPFATVSGAVPGELAPLDPEYAGYDTRQARIALATLTEIRPALDAAVSRWGPARVGMVLATSTGGIGASEEAHAAYRDGAGIPAGYDLGRQHSFFAFARLMKAVTGVAGPAYVVSTACSSSGKVLGSAQRLIRGGVLDAVLVGGIDSLCLTTLCGFAGLSVLSAERCRPFSAERKGMNIGEGGALVLVERRGDARAMLLGVGESSDAHHMSSPHPEGLGARLAMEQALEQAGVAPGGVDYVNAHGTGTWLNDAAEAAAIGALLGDEVPVSSTKGFTGHMLGAAGATEFVIAVLAIENGWIPASLGADPVDPGLPIAVATRRVDRRCRTVMSTSFGFGGSNCAVVVGAP